MIAGAIARPTRQFTVEELAKKDPQFLTDKIKARVAAGEFGFKFYMQVAEKSGNIENPAIA